DSPTRATAATLAFAADVDGATFACSLDEDAFAPCASPLKLTGLAEGAHDLRAVATVDGISDPTPAVARSTIDLTGPAVTITAGPADQGVSGPTATFAYTSPEPDATFECGLDGADVPCAAAGTTFTGLTDRSAHDFAVRALDALGNRGPAATRHFTVDATGPTTTITAPANGATVRPAGNWAFSADDPAATFDCDPGAG